MPADQLIWIKVMDTTSIRGGSSNATFASELRSATSICLSHRPPAKTADILAARSNIYTEKAIAYALCEGRGIVSAAAKILGCARQTIRDALAHSPMLRQIMSGCEGPTFDIAYQTLRRRVQIGDSSASMHLVRHP